MRNSILKNFRNVASTSKAQSNGVRTNNVGIMKAASAADRFGNPGVKNQQWSTIEIFDYLPYAPGTTLTFFENVNTRAFPFTNIQQNTLGVGEVMVIKRIWFTIATTTDGAITNVQTFEQASVPGQYLGQFSWFNDNNRVIKSVSLTGMQAEFNRAGWSTDNNVLHLETDITIQTLVRFTCQLRQPAGAAVANTFVGCHVAGMGTLLAPKGTY